MSTADAWFDRKVLQANDDYAPTLRRWEERESEHEALAAKTDRSAAEQRRFDALGRQMSSQFRPGNIYNGVLASHLGYGVRGVIWYQGEGNAGRAEQYRELFPWMIRHWRERWGIGDFPFYWVQLADFRQEAAEPSDSDWAELREAQTMTLDRVANSGQAVIIDAGEAYDVHARNKRVVGSRLARIALATDYGFDIPSRSPRYKSMEVSGARIVLSFDHVDGGWRPRDTRDLRGFAIAGEEKNFVWAQAKIRDDDRIEVWSDDVSAPVAVRYAWADNPVCNVYDGAGLPLTPFRTDDWPGVTDGRR